MKRKILQTLFWTFIFVLLILPLGLIFQISRAEMEEYAAPDSPVIRQSSIGAPVQANRTDINLYVTVSGTFTSTSTAFMELEQETPYDIRFIISYGDEVQTGQIIGYYYGEEIISTVDGIVSGIHTTGTTPYLQVDAFLPLVLECNIDDAVLSSLRQFPDSLTLKDGTKVTLEYVAKVKNYDDTTTVRLALEREGDTYGTSIDALTIYLGVSYPQVLSLPVSCIYQKTVGEEQSWYVRHVTEDGFLISEKQVSISYRDSTTAVVSGIEEGQWFDSGYKAVTGGGK